MTFNEFFEKQWPRHYAILKMYEEGSMAVDVLDCLLPHRTKNAAEATWNARNDEVESLNAQLAECQKDAERYRWLRDRFYSYEGRLEIGAHIYCHRSPNVKDYDDAVDDAMKQTKVLI